MREYIKKFELRKIITIMCVLASLFSFLIGSIGIILSGKMNENANYIYAYKEYTNLVEDINTNILKMRAELLRASREYDTIHKQNIKESNEIIVASINEYNSTEYESAIEEEYINNLESSYKEYYIIVENLLKDYRGEKQLENKTETIEKMISLENEAVENINISV